MLVCPGDAFFTGAPLRENQRPVRGKGRGMPGMRIMLRGSARACRWGLGGLTAGVLLAAAAPAAGLAQRWTVVPSPDRGSATSFNTLGRVSCVPARACVAVGYYVDHAGKIRTLAEAWNGTAWSLTPSVNKGSGVNGSVLIGVSCTAATACVAVGSYSDAAQIYRTLGESWNGRTWTVIPTPDAGQPSGNNSLNGVSCVSARACLAVGWYQRARHGVQQTLAESWNGTSWTVVPTPDAGGAHSVNVLTDVSCASARSCAAVGYYISGPNYRTLAESWNGKTWSVVPTPDAGGRGYDELVKVSCARGDACMAVGSYAADDVAKTLTETTW